MALCRRAPAEKVRNAALAAKQRVFEVQLDADDLELLAHHRVFERVVLPAAGHVEMALAAGAAVFSSEFVAVEDMVIHQALVLPEGEGCVMVDALIVKKEDTE